MSLNSATVCFVYKVFCVNGYFYTYLWIILFHFIKQHNVKLSDHFIRVNHGKILPKFHSIVLYDTTNAFFYQPSDQTYGIQWTLCLNIRRNLIHGHIFWNVDFGFLKKGILIYIHKDNMRSFVLLKCVIRCVISHPITLWQPSFLFSWGLLP